MDEISRKCQKIFSVVSLFIYYLSWNNAARCNENKKHRASSSIREKCIHQESSHLRDQGTQIAHSWSGEGGGVVIGEMPPGTDWDLNMCKLSIHVWELSTKHF